MAPLDVEPEYLALVDPDTFEPVDTVNGRVLVAVAARVGDTRLIDNALLQTRGGDPDEGADHDEGALKPCPPRPATTTPSPPGRRSRS